MGASKQKDMNSSLYQVLWLGYILNWSEWWLVCLSGRTILLNVNLISRTWLHYYIIFWLAALGCVEFICINVFCMAFKLSFAMAWLII